MPSAANSPGGFSVLRVVRDFAPRVGGSITHILELAKVIDPYLDDQVIFAPRIPGWESFDPGFPVEIARARTDPGLMHSPVIDDLLYSRTVRDDLLDLVAKRDINIVHFHSAVLAAYLIPFLRSRNPDLRFVVMVHGWPDRRSRRFGISCVVAKILIGRARPDHCVVLEDGSQIRELQDALDGHSIPWTTVYHAIDTRIYSPSPSHEEESFTVLYPHRMVPIKRPDLAVEIFRRFHSLITDGAVSLDLPAGDPTVESTSLKIPDEIASLVRLRGGLDQTAMVESINRSSVAIGTSLNSNTGLAIQESMACAKPVVVFNNGRISDLISDGYNGILIEPGNIEKFVEALVLLYRNVDLRASIGGHARDTIVQKRSWETRIESELSVYREILE